MPNNTTNPMKGAINWMPAVVLALVAALVSVFGLYVKEKADKTLAGNRQSAATGGTGAAGGARRYRWRMVTTWPKNFPGVGMAAENFSRIMGALSDGRFEVRVYGANELVPALGVFDAVSSGSVEMGHGVAYYWKGKISSAPFFASVPFGLNAQEINGWLFYGGGMELWREVYAPFNIIPFAAGNTGVQMAGWFNRKIDSIEDLKGLKMRIPGFGGEVLNRVGGTAVTIPGSELYTSLQTGVIDATEWVGPYNDLAFGFHQVAKYYYYPGWHESGPTLELIVNKDAYESLPADLQAMVSAAARVVNQNTLDEYTARNNAALRELVEKHGVDVRRLPADVLSELRRVAEDMYRETAAVDPTFARVYEAYREFAEQVGDYHKISEHAYYETRVE